MSERSIVAAMFVTRPGEPAELEALAARAGLRGGRRGESTEFDRVHLAGEWAGQPALAGVARFALHDCLQIQLAERDFLARRPLDLPADLALASDPHLGLAEAFRDACLALRAEVGAVLVHPQHASPTWIAELYRDVVGYDADALIRSAVGLLYLDDRIRRGAVLPAHRDTLPSPRGLAVFAGEGRSRWY